MQPIVEVCKSRGATRPCNVLYPAPSTGLDTGARSSSAARCGLSTRGPSLMCHLASAQTWIGGPFTKLAGGESSSRRVPAVAGGQQDAHERQRRGHAELVPATGM